MKIFMRRDEAAANLPVASCKLPQPATFASQQKVKPAKRLSRRREGRAREEEGEGGRVGVGDKAMTSCRGALVASAAPLPLRAAGSIFMANKFSYRQRRRTQCTELQQLVACGMR